MPSLDRALLCGAEVTFFYKHLAHKLLLAWWTWGQSSVKKNGSAAKFIHTLLCATKMVLRASVFWQVEIVHVFLFLLPEFCGRFLQLWETWKRLPAGSYKHQPTSGLLPWTVPEQSSHLHSRGAHPKPHCGQPRHSWGTSHPGETC